MMPAEQYRQKGRSLVTRISSVVCNIQGEELR